MTKEYRDMDPIAGITIEEVVIQLLDFQKQGKLFSTTFNGTALYSDTVTMDGAYLEITGKTKQEFDDMLEENYQRIQREKAEHKAKIPELTIMWIQKGNEVLTPDKQDYWAECVSIRLNDLYRGMELGHCLDIVKVLNDGGTFTEAKKELDSQSHSGMSYGLVRSMVKNFAERGLEFFEYIEENRYS